MSIKLLKATLTTFFLLFIFIPSFIQAATVTWTGVTDTNWDTGSNWDTGLEPTSADDVIIPSGLTDYPIISSTGNTVKSVKIIGGGASLEIGAGADLTVTASTLDGLSNQGTLTVNGSLSISNTGDEGLFNSGDAFISSDGTITITGASGLRAFVNSNNTGEITNNGTISISASSANSTGLMNDILTTFVNNGDLLIDGNPSGGGLENYGPFINSGTFTIAVSNNPGNGAIYNEADITNSSCGKITLNKHIDNTVGVSFDNNGILTSTSNGINLGEIYNDGVIYNLNDGTFTTNASSNGFEFTNTNTVVWTNCSETDTNWNNDDNWSDVTPTASTDGILPAGVTFYPIIMSPANAGVLTIEVGAEIINQSTLDVQIINNSGEIINDFCASTINILSDIVNNASGEIINTGSINLVGAATFTDNGGIYTGNAIGIPPPSILLYVDKDAISGNNDGTSWTDAYIDLQDALTAAEGCEVEIWVAEGAYYPTSGTDKNISFDLLDGVSLYGGFDGTETLRNERDFVNNITTLSGDINTVGIHTDNSYRVLRSYMGTSVKIDGFSVVYGGGGAPSTIVGSGFTNQGEAIVQNCIFENNESTLGALINANSIGNTNRIINCIFRANLGFGIYNIGHNAYVINTLISGNDGGGLSHSEASTILDLDNCTIVGNNGIGIKLVSASSFNAVNSIFWDNELGGIQDQSTQISSTTNATVSFSCIEGGWTGSGSANIDTAPLFTTSINPTDSPTTAGDFTLQIASPAINTGSTGSLQTDVSDVDDDGNDTEIIDIDLAQNARVQLSILDMGAYEASESCNVESTTAYWTGNTDTDWNTPSNWCPYFVPTTNDDIFIGEVVATNYPVIDSDVGIIKSITMTDGSLTITIDGTLNINNSTIYGINISKGTITNNGSLFINSTTNRSINGFGSPSTVTIENNGNIYLSNSGTDGIQLAFDATLNNNNEGNIFITNPIEEGLILISGGEFFNDNGATTTISGAGENGLTRHTNSSVFNSGDIYIEQLAPEKKLLLPTTTSILVTAGAGGIYNYQCANITFDDVLENNATIANDGIIHANGNLFTNTGTFFQGETGIIFDPNNLFDNPGGTFTDNGNTLPESQINSTTNIWTGCANDLDWDTPENWSLEEEPQVDYDVIITDITGGSNSPSIYTAGNVAQSIEVENGASLNLNLAGELTIDNSTNNGIENQGMIINSGALNISNSTNNALNNTGIFNNSWCAEMTLTGQIISSNNFSNNGLLTTTFNGTNTITGTFINNGVINDSFDSFNEGADITNNSLIILPITGCFGESISNALIDGGSSLVINEDWLHGLSETIGGTYNTASNTFIPDNNSIEVGTHILDISIEDIAAGCDIFTTIEVEIESCTQTWTGASSPPNTDWNDPNNWSTGIIPTSTDSVAIADISPLTNYPIIDTNIEVYSMSIDLNANLEIASNGSFTVEDGLTNNGNLTNNGSIELLGGNFENNGTFSNQACAIFDIEEIIENAGTFTNNGILYSNTVTSHQNIVTGAVFTNTGILYNKGIANPFITSGTFTDTGRTLNNSNTNIWTGCNDDTDWNNPSNWSLGVIPDFQNIIVPEITPATNYPIITTTLNSILSLVVEDASTLTLADGADLTFENINNTGIDIEVGAILNINSGATVNVNNAPITGVNVDGTLNVNGDLFIVSANVGMNVGVTGIVNDEGLIEITEGLLPEKTGIISVVNFLEIQNGGTLEVKAGGNLLIDGTSPIVLASKKIGFSDGDTGIKIFNGGTLLSETTGVIEVINISGTGIEDAGEIEHSGEMTVTAEDVGIIVSNSLINDGSVDISKPEDLILKKTGTGGASVVNFLEIQNGGTLEINSGGSVTVDGANVDPVAKINIVNDDTGIDVQTGGTLTSETNTTIEVINMSGLSKGIVNNGTIDHSGIADVIVETTGIQIQSGTVENSGDINISKIEGLVFAAQKTESASVVNFLEIQNGGTLTIPAGGSLVINGQEGISKKSNTGKALLNDVGISVESGGTFIAETNSNVDVINMIGASIGVSTSGMVTNDGDFDITTEGIGIEVQAGNFNNGGELDIAKIDGLTFVSQKANTESGSVVNFLEIQNGGTLTVFSGGSLVVDGQSTLVKSSKALLNDVGIKVNTGGTLIAETNSNVDVINMVGASVGVNTGGTVTNDGDFDITTEGVGIEVTAGDFNNGGELDIAKIDGLTLVSQKASTGSGSVVNFLEIQNGGTLTVFSGGSLTVDGQATLAKSNKALSNDIGVNVNTGGTLIAQESSTVNVINMIGTSTGVLSNGSIQDAGDFNITTENIGLQVQSNSVDVTGSLDITVVEGPAKSIKSKGAISVVNFLEIQNGGTLEIFSGGQVIVDGGAVVAKNKALNNDVGVTIQVGGLVNTHVEANLQVKNIVGQGTGISNDGNVNNDGTINIINTGNNGLHNKEQFDNNDCAVFTVDSKIVNTTDGNVRNTGLLSTTYGANGGQHENNGSIINEGIIEDPNNAFVNVVGNPIIESGDGGTTNYTLFTPLSTCYGENIDNATNKPFDTNSTFNINVWYTDLSLTQVAGLFVYAPEFGINRFTPNFNVLGPGVHTLYVSVESESFSGCGAQNVVLVELTIYELPQITPIDQEICIGDLTTIPLGVEDAGGTYTWYSQETDGTMLTTGTSYNPSILPNVTTTYWVEASDGQGCESDGRTAVTLTIHDLPTPEMMTSNTNFEFCGYEDVLLGAGNYPSNYSYHWSTTATTQSITTNVAGVYTVTVSNENGCTTTASAELIDTSPVVEITDDMGICFGSSSTLGVGTYSSNDTYLWSNNSSTQTIAVEEGIYNVTVSDSDGCTGTASIAVSLQSCCIAEAGILSVTSTDLCSGDDITVTTNGTEQTAIGYELYYLLVNESTGIIEVTNTTGIFSNIFPNDYEVYSYVQLSTMPPIPSPIGSSNLLLSAIGTSYMGCYELSVPQEATMPDAPSQNIVYSTTEGPTELIHIASITIIGGTPPYSVDFTNSNNALSSLSTFGLGVYSVSHWGNAAWTLSITDANDCANDDWIISSTDNPNINITNTTIIKETCAGEENGAIDISVEGGTACTPSPNYTYTWSGPNSFTASTEDITDLAMGNYYVTISDCGGNSISNDFLVLRQPLVRGRGRGSVPCAATGNKTDFSNLGNSFLKIRPNPFSYYTTIEFGIAETALTNINIYTLDGRKVQEIYHTLADKESLHKIHFEAKDLYPGMYLLQLTTENGEMMMEKLIVR